MFGAYVILGRDYLYGAHWSVPKGAGWKQMTDKQRVIYVLKLARSRSRITGECRMAYITTPAFYDLGLNLFRNVLSVLEREEDYHITKERVGGIRDHDGRSRKWFRYRLIETPEERAGKTAQEYLF